MQLSASVMNNGPSIFCAYMNNKKQSDKPKSTNTTKSEKQIIPTVSAITSNGELLELVYEPHNGRVRFAFWDKHKVSLIDHFALDGQTRLTPLGGAAALVKHDVVRFASQPVEYGETDDLVDAIRAYLYRYVDLPDDFARLAARYVLLTWVHDRFNELPYLRRRGDFGTGKTRFMLVLGSICYKPIFAGGASTVSPIFHLIDKIGGTLLIDEADYRFSDESAQIAKILNAGNVRGFSVLRSESINGKDFRPRAFKVFGPKIVAMRGRYDDVALESRFLTEVSPNAPLRKDIPINLPNEQEAEALDLRNKLLMYRFKNHAKIEAPDASELQNIEPRLQQIISPLFAVTKDETDRVAIYAHAQVAHAHMRQVRGVSMEAEVLGVIRLLMQEEDAAGLSVQFIARMHAKAYGCDGGKGMSAKAMGNVIRTKLNLNTRKSHGVFIIPKTEKGALKHLYARYSVDDEDVERLRDTLGLSTRVDYGDLGDLPTHPRH